MKDFIDKNRIAVAIYLIWGFINTSILMLSDGSSANMYFYPFQGSFASGTDFPILHVYDISEYFVFMISPLLIFVVYRLLNPKKNI